MLKADPCTGHVKHGRSNGNGVVRSKLFVVANLQAVEKRSQTAPIANVRVKLATTASDSIGVAGPKETDLAQLALMRQVQDPEAHFKRPSLSKMTYPHYSHHRQDL